LAAASDRITACERLLIELATTHRNCRRPGGTGRLRRLQQQPSAGCNEAGGASGTLILATPPARRTPVCSNELLPQFEAGSECKVKTVAVGSGEAMALGSSGDADVAAGALPGR
jgi:hypothetical protein